MLARYATAAGLPHNMAPHRLRHFLCPWLNTRGIDNVLIQPYSGHASRQSLEIYSRLALTDAPDSYDRATTRFPSDARPAIPRAQPEWQRATRSGVPAFYDRNR